MNVKVAAYERGEVKASRELDELAGVLIRERSSLGERIGVLSRQLSARKRQAVVLGAAMVVAIVVANQQSSSCTATAAELGITVAEKGILDAANKKMKGEYDALAEEKKTLTGELGTARSDREESEARAGHLLDIVALGDAPVPVAKLEGLLGAFKGLDAESAAKAKAALLQRLETCAEFEPARWAYLVQDKEGTSRFLVTATANNVRVQRDGGEGEGELSLPSGGVGNQLVTTAARGPLFAASRDDGSVMLFDARQPKVVRELKGPTGRVEKLAIGDERDGRIAVVGVEGAPANNCRIHRWRVETSSTEPIDGESVELEKVNSIAVGPTRVALLMRNAIHIIPACAPSDAATKPISDWTDQDLAGGLSARAHWSADETRLVVRPLTGDAQANQLSIIAQGGGNSWSRSRPKLQGLPDKEIFGAWCTSERTLLIHRRAPSLDRLEHWTFGRDVVSPRCEGAIDFAGGPVIPTICVEGSSVVVVAMSGDKAGGQAKVMRLLLQSTGGLTAAGERVIGPFALPQTDGVQLGPDRATVLVCDSEHCYRLRFDAPDGGIEQLNQWVNNYSGRKIVW